MHAVPWGIWCSPERRHQIYNIPTDTIVGELKIYSASTIVFLVIEEVSKLISFQERLVCEYYMQKVMMRDWGFSGLNYTCSLNSYFIKKEGTHKLISRKIVRNTKLEEKLSNFCGEKRFTPPLGKVRLSFLEELEFNFIFEGEVKMTKWPFGGKAEM